jgi:hypothetical protein
MTITLLTASPGFAFRLEDWACKSPGTRFGAPSLETVQSSVQAPLLGRWLLHFCVEDCRGETATATMFHCADCFVSVTLE